MPGSRVKVVVVFNKFPEWNKAFHSTLKTGRQNNPLILTDRTATIPMALICLVRQQKWLFIHSDANSILQCFRDLSNLGSCSASEQITWSQPTPISRRHLTKWIMRPSGTFCGLVELLRQKWCDMWERAIPSFKKMLLMRSKILLHSKLKNPSTHKNSFFPYFFFFPQLRKHLKDNKWKL